MLLNIELSRKGYPVYWVGGGAYSNTAKCRFVTDKNGNLKRSMFTRTSGHLSCSFEQALVPLTIGDKIVTIHGDRKGINEDTSVEAFEVVSVNTTKKVAEVREVEYDTNVIPKKVLDGMSSYHNRDGNYFVSI